MNLRACAHINLSALRHNFLQVKKVASNSQIMAMIKANAYGHGAVSIAQTLPEAGAFGVATIQEAITLRQAGIAQPIVVMGGFMDMHELAQILEYQLTTVVHHASQIALILRAQLSAPLKIWLKVDTGMRRLGLLPQEVDMVYTQLSAHPNVEKPIGLMTHLACSDERDNPLTLQQIATFQEIAPLIKSRSLACSAAIIAWPQTHMDWVRPGIMLYGVSPFADCIGAELGLKPVMSLRARIIAIKELQKGESVGYGATWTAPDAVKIAVVGIGYGDGYPRHARNGTPVLIRGKRCELVGRVSMDLITVNLSNQPNAKIGDPVLLWGEGLPIEEVAHCAGTVGYELLSRITSRVHRRMEITPRKKVTNLVRTACSQ